MGYKNQNTGFNNMQMKISLRRNKTSAKKQEYNNPIKSIAN